MYDGMDEEEEAPKKKPEPVDGPLLTERDKMKLERGKRKEERQREGLSFSPEIQILHVEQEVVGDDTSALQCVLNSDVEKPDFWRKNLICLDYRERWTWRRTMGRVMGKWMGLTKVPLHKDLKSYTKGLSLLMLILRRHEHLPFLRTFSGSQFLSTTKNFSGGWRMWIALARALFIEPDLLLLDEPTNHLDLHAVLWLETYLVKWPKTFIVVSHAREFLNTVVTNVLHLQGQQLTAYRGNYDTFERTREEQLKNQQKTFEANERARSHMQSFIDKFRYNAERASLVQSRIKWLALMGLESQPYSKLISGELQPGSGTVFRSAKVIIAVFSQHHVDGLDLSSNPLLYIMRCFPNPDLNN